MAAEALYKEGGISITEIYIQLGIARSTLYNCLKFRVINIGKKQVDETEELLLNLSRIGMKFS